MLYLIIYLQINLVVYASHYIIIVCRILVIASPDDEVEDDDDDEESQRDKLPSSPVKVRTFYITGDSKDMTDADLIQFVS